MDVTPVWRPEAAVQRSEVRRRGGPSRSVPRRRARLDDHPSLFEGMTRVTNDRALLRRARTFLAAGPSAPVPLIAHVCQLPAPPQAIAERLADALLGGDAEFERDRDGRWHVVQESLAHWAEPAHPRRLDDVTCVVVDLETTGTRAFDGDRVTEICAVTVRRDEIVDVYETLVNPQRSIPAFAGALTRITRDMVKDAPTFREIAPHVAAVLRDRLFVAHNAAFDWRFLRAEMARAASARVEGERLCTVRLARAVLPQVRRRSLDALTNYFGIENRARHRAGGDAVATAHVLVRLLREARALGCETLDDIRVMTRPTMTRRRRRRRAMPGWSDGGFAA